MADNQAVQPGTLALMILRTLEVLGPLHGYGVARRIEEVSKQKIQLNYGTLYPALLKLEQEGFIKAAWGQSENNRKAKFYSLTAAGRKRLAQEAREWRRTADLIRRIARNHTVLLVEHDMHLVRQIANKVTVMHQGQVLAEGALADVVRDEQVRAVYLGKGGTH